MEAQQQGQSQRGAEPATRVSVGRMTFAYYRELLMNGVLTAFASVIVVFCALVIRKIVKDSNDAYDR